MQPIRRFNLEFPGAKVIGVAGLLLYRELDEVLGLTAIGRMSGMSARGKKIQHGRAALLRQFVFSRLAGLKDRNDADRMRFDPDMRQIVRVCAEWELAASISETKFFETQPLNKQVLKAVRLWVFTLVAVSLSHSEAESKTDTSEVSGGHTVQVAKVVPEFPDELLNTVYYEGFAKVVFMVDEAGNNYDFILLEATHPLFGAKALEALRKWKVTPPIVDGQPCPTRHTVTVNFSQQRPVLIDRPIGETGRPDESSQNRPFHYRVCDLGDLDQLPKRIETITPVLPKGTSADAASGKARILFFIDKEGRVRAPDVLFSSSDVIADAAITAISEWRFEPPRKNGNPVVVQAIQTIRFEMGGAERSGHD